MKFLLFVGFLFACVMMKKLKTAEETAAGLKKYFHKKMCYCVDAENGLCEKLKCCDVYKYVPYKIVIKMCRYGDCKFVNSTDEEEDEEEIIHKGGEKDSQFAI